MKGGTCFLSSYVENSGPESGVTMRGDEVTIEPANREVPSYACDNDSYE